MFFNISTQKRKNMKAPFVLSEKVVFCTGGNTQVSRQNRILREARGLDGRSSADFASCTLSHRTRTAAVWARAHPACVFDRALPHLPEPKQYLSNTDTHHSPHRRLFAPTSCEHCCACSPPHPSIRFSLVTCCIATHSFLICRVFAAKRVSVNFLPGCVCRTRT